jgi:hypothetical protein
MPRRRIPDLHVSLINAGILHSDLERWEIVDHPTL